MFISQTRTQLVRNEGPKSAIDGEVLGGVFREKNATQRQAVIW